MTTEFSKPGYDEWKYWVDVIIDRLTSAIHVYNKPPYEDIYIPDNERQMKVEALVGLLRRLHSLMDNNDSLSERTITMITASDENTISKLQTLIREVLRRLPTTSSDMQYLLKSPWDENCTGKTATEIFRGPENRLPEGIGSGRPEHGRLPEVLAQMLEREQGGEYRASRSELPGTGVVTRTSVQPPHRTKKSYGSAGRVD